MSLALAVLGWILFGLAILVGLALDLVGLFGNWIILAAFALVFVASDLEIFSWTILAILLVLAIIGEIAETAAAGYGAAKFGGSKGSMVAAIAGTIAGAILGTGVVPILGTIVGAAIGAFIAAGLYEYIQHGKSFDASSRVGVGAAFGKVLGLFAKTFVGFAMLFVAAVMELFL
jgi:uncharacterized protein